MVGGWGLVNYWIVMVMGSYENYWLLLMDWGGSYCCDFFVSDWFVGYYGY